MDGHDSIAQYIPAWFRKDSKFRDRLTGIVHKMHPPSREAEAGYLEEPCTLAAALLRVLGEKTQHDDENDNATAR